MYSDTSAVSVSLWLLPSVARLLIRVAQQKGAWSYMASSCVCVRACVRACVCVCVCLCVCTLAASPDSLALVLSGARITIPGARESEDEACPRPRFMIGTYLKKSFPCPTTDESKNDSCK